MAAGITLTATAHQARFLRDRWSVQQLQSGKMGWESPEILSIQAWMRQQWDRLLQQGVELPLLLRPYQERLLWQKLLHSVLSEQPHFLRQYGLVDPALQASRLFAGWHVDGDLLQ